MTIDKRSALEGVFAKIASEKAASNRAYRRFCILKMADNYKGNESVDNIKAKLRLDRLNRRENPLYNKIELYRWGLLAALIAEKRP